MMENERSRKSELNNESQGDGNRLVSKTANSYSQSTEISEASKGEEPLSNHDTKSEEAASITSRMQRRQQLQELELAESMQQEEDSMKEDNKTRESRRKSKEKEKGKTKKRRGRIRLIPVWFKLIVFLLLLAGSLVAGAMFGYGFVGDGEEPRDILDREIWYKIYDFIYTDTELERTEDWQ